MLILAINFQVVTGENIKRNGITYEETERDVAAYICWSRIRPISIIPEVTIKL
jgi:hypothetical protein